MKFYFCEIYYTSSCGPAGRGKWLFALFRIWLFTKNGKHEYHPYFPHFLNFYSGDLYTPFSINSRKASITVCRSSWYVTPNHLSGVSSTFTEASSFSSNSPIMIGSRYSDLTSPSGSFVNILVRWNRTSGNLEIRCPESGNHLIRVYSRNVLSKP